MEALDGVERLRDGGGKLAVVEEVAVVVLVGLVGARLLERHVLQLLH